MGEKAYRIEWLMPLGMGEQYGVKQGDLPKDLERLSAQSEWLNSTEYGLVVWRALKAAGFEVADVGTSPVFTQRMDPDGKRITFWVPYVRWWQHTEPVGYKVHYIPVRVDLALALTAPASPVRLGTLPPPPESPPARPARMRLEASQVVPPEDASDGENEDSAASAGSPADDTLRTFEVYGVRSGSIVNLMQVLEHHAGRWHVKPECEIRVASQPGVGLGLAGKPGHWRDYYPTRRPEEYGLDPDKGVLYWEPKSGRALAASTALLTNLFGRSWRSTVYRTEE